MASFDAIILIASRAAIVKTRGFSPRFFGHVISRLTAILHSRHYAEVADFSSLPTSTQLASLLFTCYFRTNASFSASAIYLSFTGFKRQRMKLTSWPYIYLTTSMLTGLALASLIVFQDTDFSARRASPADIPARAPRAKRAIKPFRFLFTTGGARICRQPPSPTWNYFISRRGQLPARVRRVIAMICSTTLPDDCCRRKSSKIAIANISP